jgi:hypothetical protein
MDKFRHLLLRFARLSQLHYAFKTLAYRMTVSATSADISLGSIRVVAARRAAVISDVRRMKK